MSRSIVSKSAKWVWVFNLKNSKRYKSTMYDLKQLGLYEHIGERVTRQGEKYTFHTDISTTGVYARSPYYIGSKLWNSLPAFIQNTRTKSKFKNDLKAFWNLM